MKNTTERLKETQMIITMIHDNPENTITEKSKDLLMNTMLLNQMAIEDEAGDTSLRMDMEHTDFVIKYGMGLEGLMIAIQNNHRRLRMRLPYRSEEDLIIAIPPLVQRMMFMEMHGRGVMSNAIQAELNDNAGNPRISRIFGISVVDGYESGVVMMYHKDWELMGEDMKPTKIKVEMEKTGK